MTGRLLRYGLPLMCDCIRGMAALTNCRLIVREIRPGPREVRCSGGVEGSREAMRRWMCVTTVYPLHSRCQKKNLAL